MLTLRSQSLLGILLGVLSLVAFAISHLALTDIAHGEPDPWEEWLTIQVSSVVVVLFVGVSLATFVRYLRSHA